MASFFLTVFATWGIYALLGTGIVLIYRTSRVLNIAGGEFAIFVGYAVAAFLDANVPFGIALGLGMAGASALGLLVYWFSVRRVMGQPPHVGLMLTVGIGVMLNGLMIILFGGGMKSLPTGLNGFTEIGTFRFPTAEVVAAFGAWFSIVVIFVVYGLTNIGLQMRAVAENVMLSAQRGVNVNRIVAASWAIGILAAGLAGIFHGERAFVAMSASVIGISALIACLIGGMDSLKGVVIAAFLVAVAENLTALYVDPRYILLVPVLILLIVLSVRPWGLFGTIEEFKRV